MDQHSLYSSELQNIIHILYTLDLPVFKNKKKGLEENIENELPVVYKICLNGFPY